MLHAKMVSQSRFVEFKFHAICMFCFSFVVASFRMHLFYKTQILAPSKQQPRMGDLSCLDIRQFPNKVKLAGAWWFNFGPSCIKVYFSSPNAIQELSRSHNQIAICFDTESDLLGGFWDLKVSEMAFRSLTDLVLVWKQTALKAQQTHYHLFKRCTAAWTVTALASTARPATSGDNLLLCWLAPKRKKTHHFLYSHDTANKITTFETISSGWAGLALSVFFILW